MILSLDCAHENCSVAVTDGQKTVAQIVKTMERGQAEALMPMVQDVIKQAGLDFKNLDCIAVSTGPGSFTGVRVGLAAADGLAMAADLPMIGVSLLEAVAYNAHYSGSLCVVLETKRTDFYAQLFENSKPIGEPFVAEADYFTTLTDVKFAGNAVERLIDESGDKETIDVDMPTAETIGKMAAFLTPSKRSPAPLYLREAEVSQCRK